MFDMPAAVTEGLSNIDLSRVSAAVEDYAPVIDVVKKTWDKESLLDIMQGHIAVPDTTINQALAARIHEDSPVTALTIASKENGRMEVQADTKKFGRVEFSGTVDAFVHDGTQSYMVYTVKERALKDHGLMSWFFSRISLSLAEKLVGHVDLAEDLPTTITGNSIRVDYHALLMETELGKTTLAGHNLLEALHVEKAVPHDGYVEFSTSLDLPENVKHILLNILKE